MGNKIWSIVFGVTMLACLVGFAISPWMGWWMPTGMSTHAADVDFFFDFTLWVTTFFFILTEAILVVFMWVYVSQDGKRPVSEKAEVPGFLKPLANILDNQHKIEMAWTIIPAGILIFIALAQVSTWANIKYEARKGLQHDESKLGAALQVAVSARQFEWRMRYPSVERFKKWKGKGQADFDTFGKIPQADDVQIVNELHIWQHHQVVVHLSTRDVIHSFNLPNFRVKQDALPGKMIPVWFKTLSPEDKDGKKGVKTHNCKYDKERDRYIDGINPDTGKTDPDFIYDIACAELCGWGHYRMIGRVFVHKDREEFQDWLEKAEKAYRKRN